MEKNDGEFNNKQKKSRNKQPSINNTDSNFSQGKTVKYGEK